MSIEPIVPQNKLSGNPDANLLYKSIAKLKDGNEIELADPKATRAMVALMDMQAVMGGAASHWGGPAAFAELMSAIHAYVFTKAKNEQKPWYEMFQIVNDAGHCENGIYALKANYQMAGLKFSSLKGFRSIESQLTGHGEAHLFPEGVYISNGPLGSGLPQAQGLSIADALKGSERITVTAISDGGCMEGEAREALAAIPGLAAKNKLGRFIMVVSDNNTKLSGRIDADCFSMEPTFSSLETLGWHVISLEKGNDLQSCLSAFEQAVDYVNSHPGKPVAIHAKTVKGFGVKATETSASGGHGFPVKKPQDLMSFLEEIYGTESLPTEMLEWCKDMVTQAEAKSSSSESQGAPKEKVQVGVAKALISMRQKGYPLISVTSDLPGSTGVDAFRKEFASEQVDVGIAESNMVNVAVGLSKEGFIPVVDTFSQFGVTKGALPLIMSALSQGPVIAIFSHAGFQDAADGASHQALSYLSMTHSVPHTDTYVLSCSREAELLVTEAIEEFAEKRKKGETPNSKIFFLGRENFPRWLEQENEDYKLGKSKVVFDNSSEFNKSVTIAAAGPTLYQALSAAENLAKESIGSLVVNTSSISQVDVETFTNCLSQSDGNLVTVEDHQVIGGMGAVVTHALAQEGCLKKVKSLGVKGEFGQSAYKASELYEKHGLDSLAIAKAAKSFF